MPTYDYECTKCSHRFERRQGFDADPVEVCPKCQGEAHRRFHSVAVIYKGSGFYTTDYGRKNVSLPENSSNGTSQDTSSTSAVKPQEEAKSSEV